MSVKTDKRALTVEETQDRLQRCVQLSSLPLGSLLNLRFSFSQLFDARVESCHVLGTLVTSKDDELGRVEARQGQGRVGEEM